MKIINVQCLRIDVTYETMESWVYHSKFALVPTPSLAFQSMIEKSKKCLKKTRILWLKNSHSPI
jgi:hypothetical protein